jgi:hypothetical protein
MTFGVSAYRRIGVSARRRIGVLFGDCPAENQTRASRECLTERNQVNQTIERSRHRAVRGLLSPSLLRSAKRRYAKPKGSHTMATGVFGNIRRQLRVSFLVVSRLERYWTVAATENNPDTPFGSVICHSNPSH